MWTASITLGSSFHWHASQSRWFPAVAFVTVESTQCPAAPPWQAHQAVAALTWSLPGPTVPVTSLGQAAFLPEVSSWALLAWFSWIRIYKLELEGTLRAYFYKCENADSEKRSHLTKRRVTGRGEVRTQGHVTPKPRAIPLVVTPCI